MENNYFYILLNEELRDFHYYEYLSILSLIHTQNIKNVVIYTLNNIKGKYYNCIKNIEGIEFTQIFIDYDDSILPKLKYSIINVHGGIYVDCRIIFVNKIDNYLDSYYFNYNEKLIGCVKNNYFINNQQQNEKIDYYIRNINKKFIEYYKIEEEDVYYINNKNKDDLNKIIVDWNFTNYFTISSNKKFLVLDLEEEELKEFHLSSFISGFTITTFHLLLLYIFSYKQIHKSKEHIKNNIEENIHNLEKINNIDTIYWINLKESIVRNEKMENILKNITIPNKRIDAVNGKEEENIPDKYFQKNEEDVYPANSNIEYAVILSHLKALEEIYLDNNNNIDIINSDKSNDNKDRDNNDNNNNDIKKIKSNGYSLICEDDLSLEFIEYWDKDIKLIIENAPEDWEIIMLGNFTLDLHFENDYRKWNNDWSALSYLINHKSLYKLDEIKKEGKYKCFQDVMAADNYLFRIFHTYIYKYPYFTFPKNNESTIHQDHLLYHQIYKNINYFILENKDIYFI